MKSLIEAVSLCGQQLFLFFILKSEKKKDNSYIKNIEAGNEILFKKNF